MGIRRRNFLKGLLGAVALPIAISKGEKKTKREYHNKIVRHMGGKDKFLPGQPVYYQFEKSKFYVTTKYKRNAFAGIVRWSSTARCHLIGIKVAGKAPVEMDYE